MKKLTLFGFSSLSLNALIAPIFMVFGLICVCTGHLIAQNPKISIQGTLKTAAGASVPDGPQAVTFRLYTQDMGGTHLWEEAATVDVIGGIYSHYLGSVTALNPGDFASTLYLGVRIGSYELTPRTELSYAPYALSVAFAQKVVCSGAVGDVKYSILNPTQFAAVNGDCWVPMDGRALAVSDQLRTITGLTSVPNAGGYFFRSQEFSGGPDVDPARSSGSTIATAQNDETRSHNHSMQAAGNHNHSLGTRGFLVGAAAAGLNYATGADGSFDDSDISTFSAGSHTHTIDNTGGNETRPKNLNLWTYIRIN